MTNNLPKSTKQTTSRIEMVSEVLRVCAHCQECLKQIVSDPDKIRAVLYYQDEDGYIKPWRPND